MKDIETIYCNLMEGSDYSLGDYSHENRAYFIEIDINNGLYIGEHTDDLIGDILDALYRGGRTTINNHYILDINNGEAIVHIDGLVSTVVKPYDKNKIEELY